MRTLLLVLLLAQASQTQPPRPTENKGAPEENQTSQEQRKPSVDERGTDKQPLIVRVPKTEIEAQQENQDRNRETLNKNLTLGLGGATIVMAFLQWLVMRRQKEIAAEQNTIIKNQSEIMDRQRDAADRQVEYMRDTLEESRKAALAAEKSASIAKQSMVFTLRARLNIERFEAHDFSEGQQPRFVLQIRNYGGKTAFFQDNYLHITEKLPAEPVVPPDGSLDWTLASQPVEAGATTELDAAWDQTLNLEFWNAINTVDGPRQFYLWGILRYQDGFGKTRRTLFCRKFDPALTKRRNQIAWATVGGEEYNHAD